MTISPPPPDAQQPTPAPNQGQVASLDEAIQFFAAMLLAVLRNALIYSPKHSVFLRALTRAEQTAGIAFGYSPEIVFICMEKELFFAGKPMNKRGAQFQRLAEFMHSLGVQRLQVRPGLVAEELKGFALNLIGLTEAGESTGRKQIHATPHIRVGRLKRSETSAEGLNPAARSDSVGAQATHVGGSFQVSAPGPAAAAHSGDVAAGEDREAGSKPRSGSGPTVRDTEVAQAILKVAAREMAACEETLRLVAGLVKCGGYFGVLAQLSDHHAPTYLHSINVALLAAAQARVLRAPPRMVREVLLAGLFHDLGKLELPVELLDKPGSRNAAEDGLYQQHCVAGARLLTRYPTLPPSVVMAAFEHHMYAGGDGGFPQARRPTRPHSISQMVALADFYENARRGRPGEASRTLAAILDEIRLHSPTRFASNLTASFSEAVEDFELLSVR